MKNALGSRSGHYYKGTNQGKDSAVLTRVNLVRRNKGLNLRFRGEIKSRVKGTLKGGRRDLGKAQGEDHPHSCTGQAGTRVKKKEGVRESIPKLALGRSIDLKRAGERGGGGIRA